MFVTISLDAFINHLKYIIYIFGYLLYNTQQIFKCTWYIMKNVNGHFVSIKKWSLQGNRFTWVINYYTLPNFNYLIFKVFH